MINILVVSGKVEIIPEFENGEGYILATKDAVVPIGLLGMKGNLQIEYIDKVDVVTVAFAISETLFQKQEKEVLVCTSDSEIQKAFHKKTINMRGLQITMDSQLVGKSKGRTRTEKGTVTKVEKEISIAGPQPKELPRERKSSKKSPVTVSDENKKKILIDEGISEEYVEYVLKAIADSSDPEITLPMQLRLNLALGEVKQDVYGEIEKIVKGVYAKVK